MAVYIPIRKEGETDTVVTYSFSGSDGATGLLAVDKDSGTVTLLTPMPGDDSGFHFARATRKVRQHWEKGEYPPRTCWAS